MRAAWQKLNAGPVAVKLMTLGRPHYALTECERLIIKLARRQRDPQSQVIVTFGHGVTAAAKANGRLDALMKCGVQVLPDICWCSISKPVFPPQT